MSNRNTSLWKSKRPYRWITGFVAWFQIRTPGEFIATTAVFRESSKVSAGFAGLLFAGSLTFLGLAKGQRFHFDDEWALRIAWITLAVSASLQVFVYLFSIATHLTQKRIDEQKERQTKRDEYSKEYTPVLHSLTAAADSLNSLFGNSNFWELRDFNKRVKWLVGSLLFQVVTLLIGAIFIMVFVTTNI